MYLTCLRLTFSHTCSGVKHHKPNLTIRDNKRVRWLEDEQAIKLKNTDTSFIRHKTEEYRHKFYTP
jgi:hypothetical protein